MESKTKLVQETVTGEVIGAFYDVYNELGPGFLESVYESAMAICLEERSLSVSRQQAIDVWFRGHRVGEYRADLLVEGSVLVELKSCATLRPEHEAQLLNYLKATSLPVGLLMNFGPKPQFRRRIITPPNHPRSSA